MLNVFVDPVVLITLVTLIFMSTYIGYKMAGRDLRKIDNALIDNAKLLKGMRKRVDKHQKQKGKAK